MTFQIVRKLFQKVSHRTKKKGMTTTDDVVVLKKKAKKKARERQKKSQKKRPLDACHVSLKKKKKRDYTGKKHKQTTKIVLRGGGITT